MSDAIEIKSVDKSGPSHEHITHVGSDSVRYPIDTAVRMREQGTVFYTVVGNSTAVVDVVKGTYRKFLRSRPDATPKDNLLSLPACPPFLRTAA